LTLPRLSMGSGAGKYKAKAEGAEPAAATGGA